jgi:putative membrane protein insertion efficiency factor
MKYIAILLIWLYQHTLSLLFQLLGVNCRFYPTCSHYSREAFEKHGFFKGFWLSARRISRCHPWGGSGVDGVPE